MEMIMQWLMPILQVFLQEWFAKVIEGWGEVGNDVVAMVM